MRHQKEAANDTRPSWVHMLALLATSSHAPERAPTFEQLHYGSNLLQDMIVGMQVTGNR